MLRLQTIIPFEIFSKSHKSGLNDNSKKRDFFVVEVEREVTNMLSYGYLSPKRRGAVIIKISRKSLPTEPAHRL